MELSIQLTGKLGGSALVSEEDYKNLKKHSWYQTPTGYAARGVWNGKNMDTEFMHKVVNQTEEGKLTDHINRNKLDNRRENLRSVTAAENRANTGATRLSKTGVKGVCFHKASRKWIAQTKGKYLGVFNTIKDAQEAYHRETEFSS